MTIEGDYVPPPRAPVSSRILMWAAVIAIIAGALSLAAFALWLALLILPIALGAALIAAAMVRYRIWQAQRSAPGQRGLWRP